MFSCIEKSRKDSFHPVRMLPSGVCNSSVLLITNESTGRTDAVSNWIRHFIERIQLMLGLDILINRVVKYIGVGVRNEESGEDNKLSWGLRRASFKGQIAVLV